MAIKNILNFRKPSRIIIIAAITLVVVLSVGVALNRADKTANESAPPDTSDWETYIFPAENYDKVFFKCNDTPYHTDYIYFGISAQLMNNQSDQAVICGEPFTLVKKIGDSWKIVPFSGKYLFILPAYILDKGDSYDYTIKHDQFAVELTEGQYRIITEITHSENADETPATHIIWADFDIDGTAPQPQTFTVPGEWFGNFEGKKITLDDLRIFAEKGYELRFADFANYQGFNASSNFGSYNMLYSVDGVPLRFLVRSSDGVNIDNTALESVYEDGGSGIDIRDGVKKLEEFLERVDFDKIVYDYLDVIMSSPQVSSNSADYISEHQTEYDAILNMGIKALNSLTGILNAGEKGLRAVIAAGALNDIIERESKNLYIGDGARAMINSAKADLEKWRDDSYGYVEPDDYSDLLGKIYLGMTEKEVKDLFGEPDFAASGLMWFGYDNVGIFDPSFSKTGVIERISAGNKNWSVHELISSAVKSHYEENIVSPVGAYPCEWHEITSMDANKNEFTVEVTSQYELYMPDGGYDVRRVHWEYAHIKMTFAKNTYYNYVMTSCNINDRVWAMGMAPVQRCYDDAMYYFVGATRSSGRFGIGLGTVNVTDYAESMVTDDGEFLIKYFPGATLQIEEDCTGNWILEYSDPGKNIAVGWDGTGEILITEDLIGIYNVDDGRYNMKFEKHVR